MKFEEWWKKEGKEMKFYAGEYVEHRGIAKEAYKAALQEAARELGPWLKHDRLCRVDGCVCGLEQKIMQLGEG